MLRVSTSILVALVMASSSTIQEMGVNPFKGRALVRSANHKKPIIEDTTLDDKKQAVVYSNISVQYDYMNPNSTPPGPPEDDVKSRDVSGRKNAQNLGSGFFTTRARLLIPGRYPKPDLLPAGTRGLPE